MITYYQPGRLLKSKFAITHGALKFLTKTMMNNYYHLRLVCTHFYCRDALRRNITSLAAVRGGIISYC